jgi:thioredoxin-like negative regulator of GroEL
MATRLPDTGLVLVDFTAQHCAPCVQLGRVLDAVARDYAGRLAVVAVDVDVEPELAQQFDVRATPTVVVWRDGRAIGRIIGARPQRYVVDVVERALAGATALG